MKESIFANLSSEELENIKDRLKLAELLLNFQKEGTVMLGSAAVTTQLQKIQRQFRNLSSILVRKCTKDFF